MLKKQGDNPNRKSIHYQRQKPFEGSHRQIRGLVLREIIAKPFLTEFSLIKKLDWPPEQIRRVLHELQKEGFIRKERKIRYTVV